MKKSKKKMPPKDSNKKPFPPMTKEGKDGGKDQKVAKAPAKNEMKAMKKDAKSKKKMMASKKPRNIGRG